MKYIFGWKNYYIAIFPLFAKGGGGGYIAIFSGRNLLYSHFPAYPGKGGNGYGEKWLYNTRFTIVLKHRASLARRASSSCQNNFFDGFLLMWCNFKFEGVPFRSEFQTVIELIAYWSVPQSRQS